ncbi:50S ribosomal protein L23 [Ureaplasma ceti]|uniref:Large ribosomal subunit protein uL23 n=1 Tax=Ureaplasma ceti TaxID=3119530 RepID=A0ABP9U579_9BACT
MELTQIIVKPYLTEKTYTVRTLNEKEVIAFVVNPKASKHEIKFAFEAIYGIKAEKINTITKLPVATRTGTQKPGMTKLTKIAYVTLPAGVKLAVTKEEIEEVKEEMKEEAK